MCKFAVGSKNVFINRLNLYASMIERRFDLSVSNYGTARRGDYAVTILPWGATEPHNQHLPYMTDCILAHDVAVEAAGQLYARHGIMAMVMPPVFAGAQNPGQRELNFCVHYSYDTQRGILRDIVASLYRQGQRRLLIVNGHGGNCFKNMIRDLTLDYPDFIIATSEWFKMVSPKDYFDVVGDHADEVETSVMMHYHPELVCLGEAGDGDSCGFSIGALKEGRVWIPRNWAKVSRDTGIGSPALATAEKGKRFAGAVVGKYVEFLKDFAAVGSIDDLYEKGE